MTRVFLKAIHSDLESISRNSYGTPYDFIKNIKMFEKIIWYPLWFYKKASKCLKNHMVPPMIFLELLKYWKNHMVPTMIFDKTNQQYNIFVWYSLKNIQINFSKCLYIPPPWNFQKSDLRGGVYRGKPADWACIFFFCYTSGPGIPPTLDLEEGETTIFLAAA